MGDYERMGRAILYLEERWRERPGLEQAARAAGLSPFHFQRTFRRWAGVGPKRFLQYLAARHAKGRLREPGSVLEAAYDSGLSGPGRLHDLLVSVEAVTPGEYKSGGRGLIIGYGTGDTPFGRALAAVTERGLCGFSFLGPGGRERALSEIRSHWPAARFTPEPRKAAKVIAGIFRASGGGRPRRLELLLKGTAFQLKVWEALLRIPAGQTLSYGQVAEGIGAPRASRAVGSAVAVNAVAYLIPCHRVIRETGVLGDYRWGPARKKVMLAWEGSRARQE